MTECLTRSEVAAKLKISTRHLDYLRRQGFPEPIKLSPRRIVWREADVEAWVAAR